MVLPQAFQGRVQNLHYYQGVIIAQVAVTLVLYIVLRIAHYVKWGYAEQSNDLQKKAEGQGEEQATTAKWEQKVWDVYFPIIYTNHMACMALTLCFIPYIFEAILAYIHFAMFCGLIIVNIFIKDVEPGNGYRTKITRIFWIVMCITNIIQIIAGLTGIVMVL